MARSQQLSSSGTHERLRSLVAVERAIVAELSLDSLLQLIVESARRVVDAEYAVLEVVGPSGALEQFIQSGTDKRPPRSVVGDERPGGLSGIVPQGQLPLRRSFPEQTTLRTPVAATGVRSLLGVPVGSAGQNHGNLFLANRLDGEEFSDEDETIVSALVAPAGIAIENARLYGESQRRLEWLTASTEISQLLLSGDAQSEKVLEHIATTVQRLAQADTVAIILADPLDPEVLAVAVSCGRGVERLRELRYPVASSIAGRAMKEGRGVLAGKAMTQATGIYATLQPLVPVTEAMALPFRGTSRLQGAILALRVDPVPFTSTDLELAEGFAGQAALALELAESRREQQQLAVMEDRARIARDLHDHVVQKLFAAGLTLQATMSAVRNPAVRSRLEDTVGQLDDTIRRIRTSILALQSARAATDSFHGRLMVAVHELAPVLGFSPTLRIEGPVDVLLHRTLAAEVEGVVREAVTNVALHANATAAEVRLATDGRRLSVTVSDDGTGLAADVELSGLTGLRARAEALGGSLDLASSPTGGLQLTWTIPV